MDGFTDHPVTVSCFLFHSGSGQNSENLVKAPRLSREFHRSYLRKITGFNWSHDRYEFKTDCDRDGSRFFFRKKAPQLAVG